jgi:2-polyprenyl-3-methyl-5-hydroxy-6-metoxy-1,4-benzoquinol methylase
MKPLEEIYGKRFFARRHKLAWRAPIVVDAIQMELNPSSVVDVGCATGDLVKEWQCRGTNAIGVEGSTAAKKYAETNCIWYLDFRIIQKLNLVTGRYHLVTCFEVLEHIEPESESIFVKNITDLSNQILCSAAPPGQGGHHHVNCQPPEYWIDAFSGFGYSYDSGVCDRIKAH